MLSALKRYTRLALFALVSLAFVLFAIDNRETAHVSLFPLPYVADMPLFLFALLCFALGAVCGIFFSRVKLLQLRLQVKGEQKRATSLQNQLNAEHAERTPTTVATSLPPAA